MIDIQQLTELISAFRVETEYNIIRLLNASTDKLSDTEDFITFGIAKPK